MLPIVVAGVLVLALFVFWPPSTTPSGKGSGPCVGSVDYSGQVVDANRRGLPGVVLDLSPTPPYGGVNATVTSGEIGLWSASLSGQCAYTARLYWQSSSLGPLLAETTHLDASSMLSVGVSRFSRTLAAGQHIALPVIGEYPHDANVSVSVSLAAGLNVSIGVRCSGDIALGFLPQDTFGGHETTYILSEPFSTSGTSPFVVFFGGVEVYRVEDAHANWVVYAVPDVNSKVESVNWTDPWTMAQAIEAARSDGAYPYHSVAPGGSSGYAFEVPLTASVESDLVVNLFGVALPVRLRSPAVEGGGGQTYSFMWTNPGTANICFVAYQHGPVLHSWYYGQGACPWP